MSGNQPSSPPQSQKDLASVIYFIASPQIAKEHGREAHKPLINTDQGDMLLFVFLIAGSLGGFVAGYYWKILMTEKPSKIEKKQTATRC